MKPAETSPLNGLLSPERMQLGYVIVLPGIEGQSWLNRRIVRGLISAGVPYGIAIHDWTAGWPRLFHNLRSRTLHAAAAEQLSQKILEYQGRWPQRPVYLIGHSGGCGMALKTLASLPARSSITGAVLLGAAISRGYDYRPALARVQRAVWNFFSPGDVMCLGLFMMCAGTIDGCHGCGAGLLGFRHRDLTLDESAKFEEMPFRLRYILEGHFAGHFGFTAPRFISREVAPLILAREGRSEDPALVQAAIKTRMADLPA
jgi:pimeloyl-ACP methyl ester carboxylesterase